MGYRSESIAVSRDMGPLSVGSPPLYGGFGWKLHPVIFTEGHPADPRDPKIEGGVQNVLLGLIFRVRN